MSVHLPESPAGAQARWVIESFGTLLRSKAIKEHFAPSFLEAVSPMKVRAITLSLKSRLPVAIVEASGTDHRLHLKLDGADGPFMLHVSVDEAPPHQINGLLVRSAGPSVADALRGAQADADVGGLLDKHLKTYALHGERAGLSVAVLRGGDATPFTYGAVAEDSIFEIGSITKPVTASLFADMVASGEVAFDDPVRRFLPDGAVIPGEPPITLLELATHTSGLPRLPVNLDVADDADPYKTFSLDALFDGLADTTLEGRGTVAYSNLGYTLLGQVLARAAGVPYTTLVTERVLRPLGMIDARVEPEPALEARRVPGHARGEVVPHWTMAAVAPAGGIEATAADVLAFARAHLLAGGGSALATTHQRRATMGDGTHMGLAWIIVETERGDVLLHNGGTGGFRSFVGLHPGSRTAIAVLANTADGDGPDLAAASILGALIAAS